MAKKMMGVAILAIALLAGRSHAESRSWSKRVRADIGGGEVSGCAGDEYRLVSNDEFNDAKLDATRWSIGLPWGGAEGGRWHNDQYASYITDRMFR